MQAHRVKLTCIYKTSSPSDYFDIFIDLKGISELYEIQVSAASVKVGAAVTLSNLIDLLLANKSKSTNFEGLADHILKVANVAIRNVGSWAGNLMLTHDHSDFPSDVFTVMAAAGATVTIANARGSSSFSLWDFLDLEMSYSVIVSMTIPFSGPGNIFRSFKIMPRAQNAHAYVNAAFSMEVDPSYTVRGTPVLVFGGIEEYAVSAVRTAASLQDKSLLDPNTLKSALAALQQELIPDTPPMAASVQYRKSLALSLFYKYYLACIVDEVSPRVKSAAVPYKRAISQGVQTYSSLPSNYPITQPMPKLSSALQASGEAQFTTDIPPYPQELAAAFVITTQGNARISSINADLIKTMPGYVSVITAADIPTGGQNNFMTLPGNGFFPEPVFATDFSEYAGQAVALVLADTQEYANVIARAVVVGYQDVGKPILTIQDAIAARSFYPFPGSQQVLSVGDAPAAIATSAHVIEGEISCGTQYHFHMETHTTVCLPEDQGYTVYSSTQWTDLTQSAVATVLGIPVSSVDVRVKRLGGAYGAKITRGHQAAAACALGACLTRRPVRMHMDIDTNMQMVGKRFPFYAQFKVGCSSDGLINGIQMTVYNDSGCSNNDNSIMLAVQSLDNAYYVPNWLVTPISCKTNTCSNTFCRSPAISGVAISGVAISGVAISGVAISGVAISGVAISGVAISGVATCISGVATSGVAISGVAISAVAISAISGVAISGVAISGVAISGVAISGVAISGVAISGVAISGVAISGVAISGVAISGVAISGVAISGVAISGVAISGVAISGVAISGVAISGVAISGVAISGVAISGVAISGVAISGVAISGTLPGIFIMESLVDYVAKSLGLDVEQVKRVNLYQLGQTTPIGIPLSYCNIRGLWDQLYSSASVERRKADILVFNQANRWRKRGLSMVPLKFGLGWNNSPFTVLVSVYATDGTVAVTHGGVEVGQGIDTKVAQVAARTLGIPLDMIVIKPSNSLTNPNGASTGGSTTSELACLGVLNACTELKSRLTPVQLAMGNPSWVELVQKCYAAGIDLSSKQHTYLTTDYPFAYYAYGVTCAETEVDVLTGETQVLRVDILYDCGESINPEIDVGQVEGAFVMGLGYWMTERVVYDPSSGQLLTHNTWEYKPPSSQDIPIDFRVELLKNAPNPLGILRSKACGEPPQCMSCSVLFAIKRAIESARAEIQQQQVFALPGPATVEAIQQACMVDPSQFVF
eukprot:Em0020g598a